MKWVRRIIIFLPVLLLLFVLFSNVWIVTSTESRIYRNTDDIIDHRVALVLGTSHKVIGGASNPFFTHRIDRAAELYHLKKIDHFILSGDNSSRYYNEPIEMRKALIARGIPVSSITLDYAGFRTLDSVVRSKEIFGQDKILIITQSFHSHRALFISHYYGIDAIAVVADDANPDSTLKMHIREYFARTKAVLDLYVLKTAPHFLGEKEQIIINS